MLLPLTALEVHLWRSLHSLIDANLIKFAIGCCSNVPSTRCRQLLSAPHPFGDPPSQLRRPTAARRATAGQGASLSWWFWRVSMWCVCVCILLFLRSSATPNHHCPDPFNSPFVQLSRGPEPGGGLRPMKTPHLGVNVPALP